MRECISLTLRADTPTVQHDKDERFDADCTTHNFETVQTVRGHDARTDKISRTYESCPCVDPFIAAE